MAAFYTTQDQFKFSISSFLMTFFLLPFSLTQYSADAYDAAEQRCREGGLEADSCPVGQAQSQGLVLGHEAEPGVGMDPTLVKCPGRPQDPLLLLLPPQRMV